MEQRIDRNKILWAALVMMVGAALVAGPAPAAEGDAPAASDPGVVTENPGPGPSDPGPGGPGNSDGQPGGGNDNNPGGGDRDPEENRGGDPGVIIGGPPVFEPGPQPGPGPVLVPEPEPQPQPDFEQPGPTMPPRPDRPEPNRPERPDRVDRNGRDNPIVRNDPPSTRIDSFQNIPTVNAPLVSAQPTQSTTRDNNTRTGAAAYDNGSSIIFKSAEEVSADPENTFGISAGQQSPSSSMQQMFVGTIVAVDKAKNTVVLKDRYRHTRTFYVDPNTVQTLRKGNVVQATFLPGTSKVERLQQIIG